MTSARLEPELVALRKLAEELANRRRERLTSAHLLAAIASRTTATADLLNDRRLTEEVLLRAGRASADDFDDALPRALERAREIAVRMGAPDPSSAHVLVALLSEPRGAARRVLEQCGADVGRLRTAAMNLGLGLIGRRRAIERGPASNKIEPGRGPASNKIERGRGPARQQNSGPESNKVGRQASAKEPRAVAESARRKNTEAVTVPLFPPPRPIPRKAAVTVAAAARSDEDSDSKDLKKPAAGQRTLVNFELDPQKFPTLCGLGRNLTLAAARGELDPVVGRQREIEQTLDVLAKREGNNPLLVGAAGVGKTSVVRGLSRRIAEANDVISLDDRIVIEIPVGELLGGTGVRGALASRMTAIRKEVLASAGRVVLFFDEVHQLFAGEGCEELASELKLAFAKGELPCIGATTFDEYRKAIEGDAALARRFSLVEVEEPSREDAFLILGALATKLEVHHDVRYADEALAAGVAWSVRYLPGRALPDKAVSIVDLAGARARRRGAREVTPASVAEVVAELAGMPVERLLESDGQRMLRLEEMLSERIVGHKTEVMRIARILRRNAAGLGSCRPVGTFLLLGPTGVGKTETAKAVAEVLFHNDGALTRIDLSEYSEPHSVARLIGAPPGYIGHEAGGQLTEAVRRRPYQVILLDEIEKAHPDVLTCFLAVFDEGRLTDGRGRTIDFTNSVILMTSNIGAEETASSSRRRVGFSGGDKAERSDLEQRVVARARAALAPELYNRIDEVLVFAALERAEVRQIAERLLQGVARALEQQRQVRLEIEDRAVEFLLDAGGFDPSLGARPMKRTLARLIEAPLAEKILRGELEPQDVVFISVEDGELQFDVLDGREPACAS